MTGSSAANALASGVTATSLTGVEAGGTASPSAHRSHRSHTVADSAISRPHDAQRFTRLLLPGSCPRTHRERLDEGASVVPGGRGSKLLGETADAGLADPSKLAFS